MSQLLVPPSRVVSPVVFNVSLRDLWAFAQCPAEYYLRQQVRKTKQVYAPPTEENQFVGDILHSAASASVESRMAIVERGLERASKVLPQERLPAVEKRCLDMLRWGDKVLDRDKLRFHHRQMRTEPSSGITLVTIFDAFQPGRVPTVIEFKSRAAKKVSAADDFQTIISAWLLSDEETKVVKRKILYFGSNTIIEDQFTRAELDNFMANNVRPVLRKLASSVASKQNLLEQRNVGKNCSSCNNRALCPSNQPQVQAESLSTQNEETHDAR